MRKMLTGGERVGELRERWGSQCQRHKRSVLCDVFGEWCSDRVRDGGAKEGREVVWDTSQRASSVLLRNLDFIPLPLKVIPLKVLEKGNHLF